MDERVFHGCSQGFVGALYPSHHYHIFLHLRRRHPNHRGLFKSEGFIDVVRDVRCRGEVTDYHPAPHLDPNLFLHIAGGRPAYGFPLLRRVF